MGKQQPIEKKSLDIILPLYNPRGAWAQNIIEQYEALNSTLPDNIFSSLIIVNDGSSRDVSTGKSEIQQALSGVTWVDYDTNMGKGHALRKGVAKSQGDYVIYTDHDFPYTTQAMRDFLELLHVQACEVVIGHRDPSYYENLPWIRVKVSHYLKTINKFILRLNTDDTQCGLKGFRKSIKPTFLSTKTDRFLIDIEFLRRLRTAGVPVTVFDVKSRENVEMSTLGFRTILTELIDYAKIVLTT